MSGNGSTKQPESKIGAVGIDKDELPEGTETDGLLSIYQTLEHVVCWREHMTIAKLHLDCLREGHEASLNIPEVLAKLSEKDHAGLKESVKNMKSMGDALSRLIKLASETYYATLESYRHEIISNFLNTAKEAIDKK